MTDIDTALDEFIKSEKHQNNCIGVKEDQPCCLEASGGDEWHGRDSGFRPFIKDLIAKSNAQVIAAERQRILDTLETMKKPGFDVEKLYCKECGDYDDCDCSGYNYALEDFEKLLQETTEEK